MSLAPGWFRATDKHFRPGLASAYAEARQRPLVVLGDRFDVTQILWPADPRSGLNAPLFVQKAARSSYHQKQRVVRGAKRRMEQLQLSWLARHLARSGTSPARASEHLTIGMFDVLHTPSTNLKCLYYAFALAMLHVRGKAAAAKRELLDEYAATLNEAVYGYVKDQYAAQSAATGDWKGKPQFKKMWQEKVKHAKPSSWNLASDTHVNALAQLYRRPIVVFEAKASLGSHRFSVFWPQAEWKYTTEPIVLSNMGNIHFSATAVRPDSRKEAKRAFRLLVAIELAHRLAVA